MDAKTDQPRDENYIVWTIWGYSVCLQVHCSNNGAKQAYIFGSVWERRLNQAHEASASNIIQESMGTRHQSQNPRMDVANTDFPSNQ